MVAQLDGRYVREAGLRASARRLVSYAFFEGRAATTRAQWFNSVVRRNVTWGATHQEPRPIDRPIFIVGLGRSGTTHLGKLLSAHPDVGWLNEPKLIWNQVMPGEDVSGFYGSGGSFVLDESHARPETRLTANRAFGYYLRAIRATRLVDKYPEMTYRARFLRAMFPDARIIAIVRRPEDFVNSVVDWNRHHASHSEDWWGLARHKWHQMRRELVPSELDVSAALSDDPCPTEATMATAEWVLGMRALLSARRQLDYIFRFEDLATSPRDTIAIVLRHCELEPAPAVLNLAESGTSRTLRDQPAEFGPMADAVAATQAALAL